MKIKLLIASDDVDYVDHLSKRLTENYSDKVDVNICTSGDKLVELLKEHKYDAAMLEVSILDGVDLGNIQLPLVLWADETNATAPETLKKIPKYKRISSMLANVLEQYAKVSTSSRCAELDKANVTAVWSPSGGVGKTSVALAQAARASSQGKQVIYMNLEPFSSTPVFFDTSGKSVSAVFEMLEANDGNVGMLIQSILRRDPINNIAYFCPPEDFDDINILSVDNIESLINACLGLTEELIIDMSGICDERALRVFEIADKVLLVTDPSSIAQNKLQQFTSGHRFYSLIKDKTWIVANKGATVCGFPYDEVVSLPLVQTADATMVYKTLSMEMIS